VQPILSIASVIIVTVCAVAILLAALKIKGAADRMNKTSEALEKQLTGLEGGNGKRHYNMQLTGSLELDDKEPKV